MMVSSNCGCIAYHLLDILMYSGWKLPFAPIVFWLYTHSKGKPSNINVIYTSLKRKFSRLQFYCWQYGFIFIHLAIVAYQICDITLNSQKIWTPSSSVSSKIISHCTNQRHMRNFVLISNRNCRHIFYLLGYWWIKIEIDFIFPPFSCLTPPLMGGTIRISEWNLAHKTRGLGYRMVKIV